MDKKPNLGILLMAHPKGDAKKADGGGEDEKKQMELSACEDIIKAVHAKDAEMLCSALKDFIEICYQENEEGSEDDHSEGNPY